MAKKSYSTPRILPLDLSDPCVRQRVLRALMKDPSPEDPRWRDAVSSLLRLENEVTRGSRPSDEKPASYQTIPLSTE